MLGASAVLARWRRSCNTTLTPTPAPTTTTIPLRPGAIEHTLCADLYALRAPRGVDAGECGRTVNHFDRHISSRENVCGSPLPNETRTGPDSPILSGSPTITTLHVTLKNRDCPTCHFIFMAGAAFPGTPSYRTALGNRPDTVTPNSGYWTSTSPKPAQPTTAGRQYLSIPTFLAHRAESTWAFTLRLRQVPGHAF